MHSQFSKTFLLLKIFNRIDSSKNAGAAIIYEAILTVMEIESSSNLRNLAIKSLGSFLATKDNNMRYVSLNILLKVVKVEKSAVQAHKKMILECLNDPDISIRKRSLDLSFAIIDARNIEIIMPDLLTHLDKADLEFASPLVTHIVEYSEKFAPNPKWHIDTIIKVNVDF
jgi:AP-1 complex subunit gamma-1